MNNIYDEIRSAIYSVWHRRWLALGVAWGVCLLGWLLVGLIPNSYESKARIYVKLADVLSDVTGVPTRTQRDIERVVGVILERMIQALEQDGRVELRGFGALSVRSRDARAGRNPRTGEAVEVRAKHVPFFKSGKELRERLNAD